MADVVPRQAAPALAAPQHPGQQVLADGLAARCPPRRIEHRLHRPPQPFVYQRRPRALNRVAGVVEHDFVVVGTQPGVPRCPQEQAQVEAVHGRPVSPCTPAAFQRRATSLMEPPASMAVYASRTSGAVAGSGW